MPIYRAEAGVVGGLAAENPSASGSSARRLLKGLRHVPDRLLHPWRRRRALRRLRRLASAEPPTLLFLCHGNICRSPYAERALRARIREGGPAPAGGGVESRARAQGTQMEIGSAGFIGPGRPSPAVAREVAAERGVDLSSHRSRTVSPSLLESATLVITMTPAQASQVRRGGAVSANRVVSLGDLDLEPIDRRAVPDPINRPRSDFETVFARIDRCLGPIATTLLRE